jgi:hypothetical protein
MRWLLALLALCGWGASQTFSTPPHLEAEPGGFVSIPLRAEGFDQEVGLTVEAPASFTVVGSPRLQGGRALINLLLASTAPAGEHTIAIFAETLPQLRAAVRIVVAAQAGVSLVGPEGSTAVEGDAVTYQLLVTNTGNAQDTVILNVSTTGAHSLSAPSLELAAGETEEVTFGFRASGRSHFTSITARSSLEPDARSSVLIRTTVLPFAGADLIEGPVLVYRLNLSTSYGSDGLSYGLATQLGGALSDFFTGSSRLDFGGTRLSGDVRFGNEAFVVGYRAYGSTHRLEAETGAAQGYVSLSGSGYSTGIVYRDDPLQISLSHSAATANAQQLLRVGFRHAPLPELSLLPSVGIRRFHEPTGTTFSGELGLGVNLQTDPVVGTASLYLPVPLDGPWQLNAAVSTRSLRPLGVRAEATASPRGLAGTIIVNEELSEEVSLQQRFTYAGSTSLSFGLRYRPLAAPVTLATSIGGRFDQGDFHLAYAVTTSYAFDRLSLGAYFSQSDSLYYGASLNYAVEGLSIRSSYRHTPENDIVSLALAREHGDSRSVLGYQHDLARGTHRGEVGLEHNFPSGHGLHASLAVGESFRWRIGGNFVLKGGLATPEAVVDLFGGRATGIVEGVVFHDLSRNGMREENEPGLANARVNIGSEQAVGNAEGRFRLSLMPGSYRLSASGTSADFGLTRAIDVNVQQGQTTRVDVPLEVIVNLSGTTFTDHNRDGLRDADEEVLPYVQVVLRGTSVTRTATADARGEFLFQDLVPGNYTLSIEPTSLPHRFEATTLTVAVDLQPGPLIRVALGAIARQREIVQTLAVGTLSLFARVQPFAAPPHADIQITAQAQGEPEQVIARLGETEIRLALDDGSYHGTITVPATARGVLTLTVVATQGDQRIEQQVPVVVREGPLATLEVSPSFLSVGEALQAQAHFLTRVSSAYLILGNAQYPLEAKDDYVFRGELTAPDEPAIYEVQLWADGKQYARTQVRVTD